MNSSIYIGRILFAEEELGACAGVAIDDRLDAKKPKPPRNNKCGPGKIFVPAKNGRKEYCRRDPRYKQQPDNDNLVGPIKASAEESNQKPGKANKLAVTLAGVALGGLGVAAIAASQSQAASNAEDDDFFAQVQKNAQKKSAVPQYPIETYAGPREIGTVGQQEIDKIKRTENPDFYVKGFEKSFFVEDQDGKISFFKESANSWHSSLEVLVSSMGMEVGIPINEVKLVPRDVSTSLKAEGKPATLHSLVPGVNLFGVGVRGAKVETRLDTNTHSRVLESVASHPDLARIIALDAFVGQSDGHTNNFMVDQENDRIYAIDRGRSFIKGYLAGDFLKNLDKEIDDYSGDSNKLKNIKIFVDQLDTLQQRFPKERMEALLTDTLIADTQNSKKQAGIRGIVEEIKVAESSPDFDEKKRLWDELDSKYKESDAEYREAISLHDKLKQMNQVYEGLEKWMPRIKKKLGVD